MTSEGRTIVARRLKDGTLVEVLPDGTTRPFPPDPTDWAGLGKMTEEEINAAALTDPDNPPRTPEREKHLKRVPQVKVMRRAFKLTQEEFAARFRIPLGTLRDWEQGKTEPDQAARAYLRVIAHNPKAVLDALDSRCRAQERVSLPSNAAEKTRSKLVSDLFDQPLIQNNLRGIWMEYVVAEALGPNFKLVSRDWHAWDIEFGDPYATYPQRIRIQVKNTARIQTWGENLNVLTDCQWTIALRNRPTYFEKYNPDVPCEQYGFHCELFVLCHHPVEDFKRVNHQDLAQWDFYVLPVTRTHSIYPIYEIESNVPQKKKTFVVVPKSLQAGIRNRPKIEPVKLSQLNQEYIFDCLNRWHLSDKVGSNQ